MKTERRSNSEVVIEKEPVTIEEIVEEERKVNRGKLKYPFENSFKIITLKIQHSNYAKYKIIDEITNVGPLHEYLTTLNHVVPTFKKETWNMIYSTVGITLERTPEFAALMFLKQVLVHYALFPNVEIMQKNLGNVDPRYVWDLWMKFDKIKPNDTKIKEVPIIVQNFEKESESQSLFLIEDTTESWSPDTSIMSNAQVSVSNMYEDKIVTGNYNTVTFNRGREPVTRSNRREELLSEILLYKIKRRDTIGSEYDEYIFIDGSKLIKSSKGGSLILPYSKQETDWIFTMEPYNYRYVLTVARDSTRVTVEDKNINLYSRGAKKSVVALLQRRETDGRYENSWIPINPIASGININEQEFRIH